MQNQSIPESRRKMMEAMAKHLPPSASRMELLDVNGEVASVIAELRPDVNTTAVPGHVERWSIPSASVDSIAAFDYVLNEHFLARSLDALRPGGRLIAVDSGGTVSPVLGERLEQAGYVRILVEAAVETLSPSGVLVRGEKPHVMADTLARVQQVAAQDADDLTLETFRGRYIHLLIQQTPNKPVWAREASEPVQWHAVGVERDGKRYLLAFTSLPKAVSFMQPAVIAGAVKDVNKVGKFSKPTAQTWSVPLLLNPPFEVLRQSDEVVLVPVDPDTAEAPDE